MKTLNIITSLLLAVILTATSGISKASGLQDYTEVNETKKQLTLHAGTPIVVEALETFNAKYFTPGQVISVRVKFNLVIDKQVVVAAGALGTAIVSQIEKPKGFGKAGKMIISVQSVQAVDGQQILVSGNSYTLEGDHRKGLAWGVGIGAAIITSPIFGVGIVSGFAFKGRDAELKTGTTLNSYVASDMEIDVANEAGI